MQVKGFLRDLGWTSAVMAERHDHWLRNQASPCCIMRGTGRSTNCWMPCVRCPDAMPATATATAALLLDTLCRDFQLQGDSGAVAANQYLSQLPELKRRRSFVMAMRDAGCFDVSIPALVVTHTDVMVQIHVCKSMDVERTHAFVMAMHNACFDVSCSSILEFQCTVALRQFITVTNDSHK